MSSSWKGITFFTAIAILVYLNLAFEMMRFASISQFYRTLKTNLSLVSMDISSERAVLNFIFSAKTDSHRNGFISEVEFFLYIGDHYLGYYPVQGNVKFSKGAANMEFEIDLSSSTSQKFINSLARSQVLKYKGSVSVNTSVRSKKFRQTRAVSGILALKEK